MKVFQMEISGRRSWENRKEALEDLEAVMSATMEERLEEGRRASGAVRPPEGGWGWMIVAACFISTFCIRAVTRCVSMFFVEFQLHFEKDYSSTAWIHSLIDSTTMLCAPLGSLVGNRLSCRATVMLGGLLSSAGLVLSSFASSLEFLYVSLGVITGVGFALSYTPSIAMVGRYFTERKALAYGIALSGSGIGTFLLAPAVQMLIEYYSWRGALLILGGFVSNLCVCGALMRPLEPKREESTLEETTLEAALTMTALESKCTERVTSNHSQVEPKQQESHSLKNLFTTKGAFHNLRLHSNELHGKRAMLPNPSVPDQRLTELRITECILFSHSLSEMLGETDAADPVLSDGSTEEGTNTTNTLVDINTQKEDSEDNKVRRTDYVDKTETAESLLKAKTPFRAQCFCPEASKEFGFVLTPNFVILSVSFLFLAYGCSAPVVYLVPYAHSVGVDHQRAAFLMSIFGVSGIVGNISFGWITDRRCLKSYRMLSYIIAICMEGVCCMFMPVLHSFPLLVSFSAIYGYFDGAYVALIPVVTCDTVGSTHLTSALGLVYFLHAIPYLVSPPIGGWLVDGTGNYAATFFLCGGSFFLSSLILAAADSVQHVMMRCKEDEGQKQRPLKRNRSELVPFIQIEKL